jgi:predicted MPP superfamily phosphohydrolase
MGVRRARRFGRARHLPAKRRAAEVLYDLVYAGGWPSAVAKLLGLAGSLRVNEETIQLRGANGASHLRVAFFSDLHAGPATHRYVIEEACRVVADWKPDLLLLGGDFVSFHARFAARLVEPLAKIEAPLGKIGVWGNHDLIGDEDYIAARLAEAGVRTLVNENVRLAPPYDDVWVCGLDNPEEGMPDAERAFDGAAGTRIVLMHSPDGLTWLGDREFAIAFCGHTHGGQFYLTQGRALVNFSGPLSRQYLRGGRFAIGPQAERVLLVSRGIGQGSLPMRRGADPEVHLCTLNFGADPSPPNVRGGLTV